MIEAQDSSQNSGNLYDQKEEPVLMDFHCIEALLDLPEFRVIAQVIGPKRLDLHLERRDHVIVCPHCQSCCWPEEITQTLAQVR